MRRYIIVAVLMLGSSLLSGCGQKGPLYLPPAKPAVAVPAAAATVAKPATAASAATPAASTSSGG